jgi:DNA-binding FadR family transcriptional regulator
VRALQAHVREHHETRNGDLELLADSHITFWILLAEGSGNLAYQLVLNTVRKSHAHLTEGLVGIMGDTLRDATPLVAIVAAVERRDEPAARNAAQEAISQRTQILLQGLAEAKRSRRAAAQAS